jgi:hypothetical protein
MQVRNTWRYFEIYITAAGSASPSMTEVKIAQTVGGTNVATSATVTAPNGTAFGAPGNLIDGNVNDPSYWVHGGFPATVLFDWGAGNEKTIAEVQIYPRASVLVDSPTDFLFKVSQDGVDFFTIKTNTGVSGWANAYKVFTI